MEEGSSWTVWGSWSSCSKTCGKGSRSRQRTCSTPNTANSVILRSVPQAVTPCPGESKESKECYLERTCKREKQKKWSSWSFFSSCSSTCYGGVRQRTRTCEGDRGKCFGTPTDTEQCGTAECGLQSPAGDGSMSTVLLGGWVGSWLANVTVLDGRGRSCQASPLPIWLADHFSVFDGYRWICMVLK